MVFRIGLVGALHSDALARGFHFVIEGSNADSGEERAAERGFRMLRHLHLEAEDVADDLAPERALRAAAYDDDIFHVVGEVLQHLEAVVEAEGDAFKQSSGKISLIVYHADAEEVAARVQELPAPLTFVVGRVCAEDLLGGSLSRCLSAPCVVVTGTSAHVHKVCAALDARGFTAIPCTVLRVEPLAFDFFFEQIGSFDLLAFTSPNGVEIFFSRARALGTDWRVFGGKTFAALGTETAASLREYGFCADILPAVHTAEGLAAALAGRDAARTALLRAQNGNPILCSAGVQISLYRTEADAEAVRRAAEALGAARFVTFGSAKGARALLDACSLPETVTPVCIGAETAKVLKERGYRPAVAQAHTAEALVEAVAREEEICND